MKPGPAENGPRLLSRRRKGTPFDCIGISGQGIFPAIPEHHSIQVDEDRDVKLLSEAQQRLNSLAETRRIVIQVLDEESEADVLGLRWFLA